MIRAFASHHLEVIFLVYGLSFLFLGVLIFAQLSAIKDSTFKIRNILWLLACFAVVHGLHELLDMFAIIKGPSDFSVIEGLIAVIVSYIFLLLFGYRLVRISTRNVLDPWFLVVVGLAFFGLPVLHGMLSPVNWDISARYFLAFPGGLLCAAGFLLYYRGEAGLLKARMKKYFVLAAVAIGAYGFLAGLVVDTADFFPASMINTDVFRSLFDLPVQFLRAICAILLAWSVSSILRIFHDEADNELVEAKEMFESIAQSISEGMFLLSKDFKILWANNHFLKMTGVSLEDVVGQYCYKVTHHRDSICEPPLDVCPALSALKKGGSHTEIHTHFDVHGNKIFAEVVAYPVKDRSGNIVRFIHLTKDITDKKRADEERLEFAKLSERDKMKTEFLSIVPHELRTPIAVIKLSVLLLEKEFHGAMSDKQLGGFRKINAHLKNLEEIVESILDISRIERGQRFEIKNESTSLARLIEEALESLKDKFDSKQIALETRFAQKGQTIACDAAKIKRVIVGVLGNAFKFTPQGGKVSIETIQDAGNVVITVADNGIGISADQIEKIFEKFYQVDSSSTRKYGGIGMGLAIAREIVNAHGGRIWAESQGVGQGATIFIRLPIESQVIRD